MEGKVRFSGYNFQSGSCINDWNLAQEEREFAIKAFKSSKADVLIATDVASKGLDFNEIQHVINYDMPKEIEDYGICRDIKRQFHLCVANRFL
jgi:ERCC4-related helicase